MPVQEVPRHSAYDDLTRTLTRCLRGAYVPPWFHDFAIKITPGYEAAYAKLMQCDLTHCGIFSQRCLRAPCFRASFARNLFVELPFKLTPSLRDACAKPYAVLTPFRRLLLFGPDCP